MRVPRPSTAHSPRSPLLRHTPPRAAAWFAAAVAAAIGVVLIGIVGTARGQVVDPANVVLGTAEGGVADLSVGGNNANDPGEANAISSPVDTEFLTEQLVQDVELAVSRSEASRLRAEGEELSERMGVLRGDVTVLDDRIDELEFAMANQTLLIAQAREAQRDMAAQRSEILAQVELLGLESDAITEVMVRRAIQSYMSPTAEADSRVWTAGSALDAQQSRVLLDSVLDKENGLVLALHERETAMLTNEQILADLAHRAERTHAAETRAQDSLEQDQAEYLTLKALLGEEISRSESEYVALNVLAEQMDEEIIEREAQLLAIAERRGERRAQCVASGGQVDDDGTEIDCSYLGAVLAPGSLAPPVFGPVESGFGMRRHPIDGVNRMHEGWDYDVASGAAIGAAGPGEVFFVGWIAGFGRTVIIDHGGGVETLYAHQSESLVAEGTVVATGQPIGLVGSTGKSTGPHLHFEVSVDGKPVDPASFLAR